MDDSQIMTRIHDLVEEEKTLRHAHEGQGLQGEDRTRLNHLEEQLDQAWDLLRRRRAQAEFGEAESNAGGTRPTGEVEGYLQ